ncbi:GNAT domain-containing protein [Xylariales sp. AK1849]|nr:GNAT domain-containing protein [Xylariales sp. AK1849]
MAGANPALVRTTLPSVPLPPNSERQPIRTKRLLIRPLQQDDLKALYALRTQPEAMTGTTLGRPDRDIEETQRALDFFLPPSDIEAYLFGVFHTATAELIGEGGVHALASSMCGWPEIGNKFKKGYWGQGYATEFLRGFLESWWTLPRSNVEIKVHPSTTEGSHLAAEHVYANTELDNLGSQKVLEKLGFARFLEWSEPDTQEHRLGEPVDLVGYKLSRDKMNEKMGEY